MDEQRAWLKARRKKCLRLLAVVLCFCLLFQTYPNILETLSAFAEEQRGGESTVYVSGFAKLPEEVREQTVFVGTEAEELSLPDTLEASVTGKGDSSGDKDAPDGEETPDGPGHKEEGGAGTESGDGDSGAGEGSGGEGGAGAESGGEGGGAGTGSGSEGGAGAESGGGEGGGAGTGSGNEGGGTGTGSGSEGGGAGTGSGSEGDNAGAESGGGESGGAGTESGSGEGGAGTESGSGEGGAGTESGSGDSGAGTESGSGEGGAGTESGSGDSGAGTESDSGDGGSSSGAGTEPEAVEETDNKEDNTAGAEEPDAAEDARIGVLSARKANTWLTQKTHTVTMPEYYAENVVTAEASVLENTEAQAIIIEGVTWQSEPAYDGNTVGTYLFTAVLPEGYALMEGVGLPEITVTVQDDGSAALIQALLERIAALPEAEAYLAKEPDIENTGTEGPEAEEAYEKWMEGLYAYAEEALAIQEAYEALTMEQQAQIPKEALTKLAAWLELAEEIAGRPMVMAEAETPTSGECGAAGSSVQWNFDAATGKLTITGNGAIADFSGWGDENATPWWKYNNDVTSIEIGSGVTRIGKSAFAPMHYITKVTIPDTVTSIGNNAFYMAKSLPSVTIPASVTSIEENAFDSNYSLTSVTIPGNVGSIGRYAFNCCESLTTVKFEGNVGSIGSIAFSGCRSLTTVKFEGTEVPTLGNQCFYGCPCVAGTAKGIVAPCAWKDSDYTGKNWTSMITSDNYFPHIQYLHEMTHIEKVDSTCVNPGREEYWECSACGGLFSDDAGDTATTLADLAIEKKPHQYTYTASGAVITETCGQGCNHSATATLFVPAGANLTYTGSEIKKADIAYNGWAGTGSNKPAATAIIYTNNKNVGTATAKLTISGATASLTFTITPAAMTGISASGFTGPYDGAAHGITVTAPSGAVVTYGESAGNCTLASGPAYTDVGVYTVYYQVTKTNYNTVTGSAKVSIGKCDISSAAVTLDSAALTYNGSEQTKEVASVEVNGRTLTAGTDYTVSGNKGTDQGSYTITLTGNGNYTGTKKVTFTIAAKALTAGMITVAPGPYYYTGSAVEPAVVVKDGRRTLTEGTDYTVSYANNEDVGDGAKITVTGVGNYKGSIGQAFTIEHCLLPSDKSLTDYVTISPEPTDGWYNQDITLTPKNGCEVGETGSTTAAGLTITRETGADGSTKTLYVKDGGGSIYRTEFTYKLDKTPPEADLAGMTVENGTKNLWHWIIGKESMLIKIPVSGITDAHSGVAEVSYTAAPENGGEGPGGVLRASGGNYEIALHTEFSGMIQLTVKDKAGNTTQASLTASSGKVVAEDYAPAVSFALPDTPQPNADGWYREAVTITVSVTDAKDDSQTDVLSGGLSEIRWKDGEGGAVQTVEGLPGATAPVYEKTFTITADDGTHIYYVKAVDNAGNVSAGTDGWQGITVKVDTGKPDFIGNLTAANFTKEGADIAFTPSEGGKAYWIVSDTGTEPDAQEVKEQGTDKGSVQDVTGGQDAGFTLAGLTPGKKYTVYVALEDAAGNLSVVRQAGFFTRQDAPEVTLKQLIIDYTEETIRVPGSIGEVEVYTDPSDPSGSRIKPNADGSLPVRPGTAVYIRYPEKTDGDLTTPASDKVEIRIPGRPAAPAAKQAVVTDATAAVINPSAGEEYILLEKGHVPDWSSPSATGQFTGLLPNREYDLYVRKKATGDSFASEPVKTEIRTFVTIKEPAVTGEGAGADGNTAPKPDRPNADGTVTFAGTYGEEYTPVIKAGSQEFIPGDGTADSEMTWDENSGKGNWEYTCPVPDGAAETGITVEFRKRTLIGITAEPDRLTIYADNAANENMDALTAYLKDHCNVKAAYDNRTGKVVQAAYTATGSFVQKGAVYPYTASAEGKEHNITLTVTPVSAAATAPEKCMQIRKAGGYTAAEAAAWLPAQVIVTYTGAGYTTRMEGRTVTWDMGSIGADFGAATGKQAITGTVELPPWATGQDAVSMEIEFVDKMILKEEQIRLAIPGFSYGEQALPTPQGSVTVADTSPVYTYLYSADNGATWVTEDRLPKSAGGYLIPGEYKGKLTYTGDSYIGEKTASFTVAKRPLTVLAGTLEAKDKNYDKTTDASLKEGGKAALSGVMAGDQVTLSGVLKAVFSETGPKKNIPVTVTGFLLEGRDAGYYELENTAVTLSATINNADGTSPGSGSGGHGGSSGTEGSGDDGNGENNGENNGAGNGGAPGDSSPAAGGNPSADSALPGGGSGTPTGTTPATPSTDIDGSASGTGGSPDRTKAAQKTAGTEKGNAGTRDADSLGGGVAAGSADEPEPGKAQGNTDRTGQDGTDSAQAGAGQPAEGEASKPLQASVEDGKLTITGDPVITGNLTETSKTTTQLAAGDGAVIVTVVCEEETYSAGVRDTAAVVNAVLLPEQLQLVNGGKTIEIRVDVKDISKDVAGQDKEIMESGLAEYRREAPGLTLGMYVDISLFIKVGEGGWNAVTHTEEPVEVVVGIPEELKAEDRKFYIIRSHDGEYAFLPDRDEAPDTITVRTDLFSAYAIVYGQAEETKALAPGKNGAKCGLCHICPTFLGICCFIWLAVILVMPLILWAAVWRRKEDTEKR